MTSSESDEADKYFFLSKVSAKCSEVEESGVPTKSPSPVKPILTPEVSMMIVMNVPEF